MNILDQIISEAESRGGSLHSLCKEAKVNYQAVWRCRSKGNNPTASTLGKLISALDMEILLVKTEAIEEAFKKVNL